jgi:L-asparaginase II
MRGVSGAQFAPVAVTTRSGFTEGVHFGAVVGLGGDDVIFSAGDPTVEIFPRSANKPLQADAMLLLGWSPKPEQLALACASHAGTPAHLDVVRSTLSAAGLTEADLANTPSLPLDPEAAHDVLRAGHGPTALLQNCSGKHAAMLATCVINGWDTAGYLAPDHPLQQAITARFAELTGQTVADVYVGVDGCGAPTHAAPLSGLARSYARLAAAEGPVYRAITAHPELVDGAGRFVTRLMQAIPGLMAKPGAEGVFAGAFPDGRAVAVKVADGAFRAAWAVAVAALARLGADFDVAAFDEPILGHGTPVGSVTALLS